AVVARGEIPLEVVRDVEALKNLLEDLRDADLLEDPTLSPARQEPEEGNDLHVVSGERVVASSLEHSLADPAEEAPIHWCDRQAKRDLLAEQFLKGNGLGVLGDEVQVEMEELRDSLAAFKADQEEVILGQGGAHSNRAFGLDIGGRHGGLPKGLSGT